MSDLSHTPYNHNLFIRIQCFTKMWVFNEVFVTLSVLSVDTDHKQIYATHASAQLELRLRNFAKMHLPGR